MPGWINIMKLKFKSLIFIANSMNTSILKLYLTSFKVSRYCFVWVFNWKKSFEISNMIIEKCENKCQVWSNIIDFYLQYIWHVAIITKLLLNDRNDDFVWIQLYISFSIICCYIFPKNPNHIIRKSEQSWMMVETFMFCLSIFGTILSQGRVKLKVRW